MFSRWIETENSIVNFCMCPQNKEEIDAFTNSHPTNRKQMLFLSHLSTVCLPERATLRCFYACTKLLTDDYFSQQMSLSTVTHLIKLHQRLFMWQFWPKLWLVWFVWLWLAFNFGPWFFFVIDVIGVIDVISVIDVIGVIFVIDVIQLSQNMIWRTQFYGFLYFLSSLVFFCCVTSENFHLLKL